MRHKIKVILLPLCILFLLSLPLAGIHLLSAKAAGSSSNRLLTDVRKAPSRSGKWVKKNSIWEYQYKNKSFAKSTWLKVNGKFYYFKKNGNMAVGFLSYNGKRYFLNKSGDMASGWVLHKKKWYYMNKNGTMSTNKWLTYKGNKYYLGRDGIMTCGWKNIHKKKYYFTNEGHLQTGWTKVKNTWYYLKKDGVLAPYEKASQMIFVKAVGSTAQFTMIEKTTPNSWKEILQTTAYVGRNGVGPAQEGLATTPAGTYNFGVAFGNRPDPGTLFPYTKVDATHYWVDDPNSRYYNKFVTTNTVRPDWNSAEHLIEYPTAYAYSLSINYNMDCIPGAGSAIFLHCNGGGPTAGCIAVPEQDMIFILQNIKQDAQINISKK